MVSPGTKDVGIRRFAAAVYHFVVHPVTEDQQRPLGGEHVDFDAGFFATRCPQMPAALIVTLPVAAVSSPVRTLRIMIPSDAVAGAEEAGYLMVRDDVGAVPARVDHVGGCETERIHSPSGTLTAPVSSGLIAGSRRRASSGEITSVSIPAFAACLDECFF